MGGGETWAEILRPQLLDLVLLSAFIAFAMISFFRKSVALKYVTFVLAVGYLGFTKSSLVSVSDVFRLTDLSVPEFKYSVTWYAFMLFVVASTVLWGRVYCGRVCAFGALTPGRQRAYIFHFSQPKKPETREARVAKHAPRILKGLGLDEK